MDLDFNDKYVECSRNSEPEINGLHSPAIIRVKMSYVKLTNKTVADNLERSTIKNVFTKLLL